MSKKETTLQGEKRMKTILTVLFSIIAIVYLMPIFLVLMNSFKANAYVNTETFALPSKESYVGFQNYIKGMTFGNYPFAKSVGYSLFITIVSSALILVCTSMAAWYIARVGSTLQDCVLPLRVLHGGALPDGDVHPAQDCGYAASEHPLDHPHHLSWLWCGPGCVYVLRLRKIHPPVH